MKRTHNTCPEFHRQTNWPLGPGEQKVYPLFETRAADDSSFFTITKKALLEPSPGDGQ